MPNQQIKDLLKERELRQEALERVNRLRNQMARQSDPSMVDEMMRSMMTSDEIKYAEENYWLSPKH
jgi:hypothetical protein